MKEKFQKITIKYWYKDGETPNPSCHGLFWINLVTMAEERWKVQILLG